MTNWIVTQTNRFKAAVTMRSTCNRMSQFGASDAAFMNGDFEFDGDPWDNPEAYLRVSPLMYVRKVETPVMLILASRTSDVQWSKPKNGSRLSRRPARRRCS